MLLVTICVVIHTFRSFTKHKLSNRWHLAERGQFFTPFDLNRGTKQILFTIKVACFADVFLRRAAVLGFVDSLWTPHHFVDSLWTARGHHTTLWTACGHHFLDSLLVLDTTVLGQPGAKLHQLPGRNVLAPSNIVQFFLIINVLLKKILNEET